MSERFSQIGTLLLCTASMALFGQQTGLTRLPSAPLAQRIVHTDPTKYRHLTAVHNGVGSMDFTALLGIDALDSNLIFFHRGVIQPKSGIGAHFHNRCEEMFVILDGEAQFTIDGRTSLLKGPAGAPARLGHSHGIYNATDKPVQWININVGLTKTYDTFNLNDTRVDTSLDNVPTFISMRLDKSLLKPIDHLRNGTGTVLYRRVLEPSVFFTAWSYVDHLLILPSSSVGENRQPDMSEVYYVLAGSGVANMDNVTAPIHTGDVIPVRLGEGISFMDSGKDPLEFMVVGISRSVATKEVFLAGQHAIP
jgi:mannose-6-phosphate isomerase-like protein (cupin superfamily)